jgi:hypothetical protein
VSLQSPAAVAQSTTAEQTLTIQTGTGATMLLASGDLLFVNKPTSQAGLGVGNVRVSSSNTLGITFDNLPAGGNITPTASQNYVVVALRGLGIMKVTAALTPAAVAANSAVEQQFSVTGLPPGYLVQVSKPTAQAGLDIGGCRVVSSNLLGITFVNATASPITPTAAETYSIAVLPGLDAANNDVFYGMNVGTVGAIGPGVVVTGGSTTLTGVLATDVVAGVMKPTLQAAATNAAIPFGAVLTADTCTLSFFGVGTGYTPTASEVYGISTKRIAPVAPAGGLQPVARAHLRRRPHDGGADLHHHHAQRAGGGDAGLDQQADVDQRPRDLGCRVSAANTLAINFANFTSAAIVPPTESYLIGNFQTPTPGAGNCVYQSVVPALAQAGNLANAIRAALGPASGGGVNLITGA